MAKSNTYEYIYDDTYPAGTTEARLIDDIFRAEKEALYNRMDQEHYWRRINDTDYDDEAEGAHRPESARVWNVDWTPGATTAPEFPDADSWVDKALFAVTGEITEDDDTGNQWAGTLWFADGEDLFPAIRRIRGKLRVNGAVYFGKENLRFDGTPAGAFTVNEGIPERGSNTANIPGNNITLIPFHLLDDAEWGDEGFETPEGSKASIVYPIRVGNYRPTDGDYTAPAESSTEGMALIVGNYPSGNGVAYVFTRRGIEVFASGDDADTEDITFSGISLRKHDHSGDKMGTSIVTTPVDPENDAARSAWYKQVALLGITSSEYFPKFNAANGETTWSDTKVIEGGVAGLYPDEDISIYPVSITAEASMMVSWESSYLVESLPIHFQLRVQETSTSPWLILRVSSAICMLASNMAGKYYTLNPTVTWLFGPGELPAKPYRIQCRGMCGERTRISGTGTFTLKAMGWRR